MEQKPDHLDLEEPILVQKTDEHVVEDNQDIDNSQQTSGGNLATKNSKMLAVHSGLHWIKCAIFEKECGKYSKMPNMQHCYYMITHNNTTKSLQEKNACLLGVKPTTNFFIVNFFANNYFIFTRLNITCNKKLSS